MPRRVGKNLFDVDRQDAGDQPTVMAPPESVPTPLGGLLPRVSDGLEPAEPALTRSRSAAEKATGAAEVPAVASKPATAPRGQGGRPAGADREPVGITIIPARVPASLYTDALDLVKGRGKPSWGQLVSWTCQDASDAVLEAVAALVEVASGSRRLRGQNREGGATTQVTARMTPEELVALEGVRAEATMRAERDVNRTVVVIGALQVATQRAKSA